MTTPAVSGNNGSMSTQQMEDAETAMMEQQNANQVALYKFSSQATFSQTAAQTLGDLGLNAAKAKPNVQG